MQGIFLYKLYGTKEELKDAKEKIKELAQKDEHFKILDKLILDINDPTTLCYGLEESRNLNFITFTEEEMMEKLSKHFKDLEIYGECTLLVDEPFSTYAWHSLKGDNSFDPVMDSVESLNSQYEEIYLPKKEFLDENKNLIRKSFPFTCNLCQEEIEIPIKNKFINDDEDLYSEFEFKCPICQLNYEFCVTLEEE